MTCASNILRSDDLSNCASAVSCTVVPFFLLAADCFVLADKAFVLQLHPDKQRAIAEELDRNPGEVLKKIEDIRNKIL